MGMEEAKAGRLWREGDAAHAMRGNVGRALLRRAIDSGGQKLAVPMQLFGRVRVVVDVDDNTLAFCHAQERAGELAVVGLHRQGQVRPKLDEAVGDADRVIGGCAKGRVAKRRCSERHGAAGKKQAAAVKRHAMRGLE